MQLLQNYSAYAYILKHGTTVTGSVGFLFRDVNKSVAMHPQVGIGPCGLGDPMEGA